MLKNLLASLLWPLARIVQKLAVPVQSLWSFSLLKARLQTPLHPSNVILGPVTIDGTGRITMGCNSRIYPGVVLETQGAGEIVLGDNVVLSRGVHIVAFDKVELGNDCMIGEYTSLRDADHKKSRQSMRLSGHESAAIRLGHNVWIGRGAVVLKGVQIGSNSIIGANAVVTRAVPESSCALGIPARAQKLTYTA
jgi:acetyltransferase-like isoleucine patch superfamily enzyme